MHSGDTDAPSLEVLMARALTGDGAAYAQALRRVLPEINTFLNGKVLPKDREDIAQDILLSLHKARHTYDATRPLMPWVMAIARFRLQDHWRGYYRRRADQTSCLDDIQELPGADVTKDREASEDIRRVAKDLPPKQQEILNLMYGHDKSVQEVATALNMSVSAVKVAAHRAYKVFRQRLKSK
ncbi:MAG: sigma-70 family RNA polymerase sigma factor [Alphaproteobacteria bacterium]